MERDEANSASSMSVAASSPAAARAASERAALTISQQAGAMCCGGEAPFQAPARVGGHTCEVAYHRQSHVILYQVGGLALYGDSDEVHQSVDLGLRTMPVFCGESIQGETFHPCFRGDFSDTAYGRHPLYMAFGTVETAGFRPASVTVHYDSHMGRHPVGVEPFHQRTEMLYIIHRAL